MKKNQKVSATYSTKFTSLFAAFNESGVFGKLGYGAIILVGWFTFFLNFLFSALAASHSAKAALATDKAVKQEIEAVREGVFAYGKHTLDDNINNNVVNTLVNKAAIAIGGPVEEALADNVKKHTHRALLKRYFKALKIKDKTAILMIKKDGNKLLEKLAKKHGPIIDLEQSVLAKKLAKRAK